MERHEVGLVRKHRQTDYQAVLREVAESICGKHRIEADELYRKGRSNARSAARREFCRRANAEKLIPQTVIARFLRVSIPAVSAMLGGQPLKG